MSNHYAIATVTACLKSLLNDAIEADFEEFEITTVRPDTIGKDPQGKGVNIFLYRVAPAQWNNADLPGRRSPGQPLKRPHIALDLNYILTFYGKEEILEPQLFLGSAIRALESKAILDKETIEKAKLNDKSGYLKKSNLAEQIQSIKFIPIPLSTEDLSKIWSVFFQTPYFLSIAYQASMVLIESQDIPSRALPVRQAGAKISSVKPLISEIISFNELSNMWGKTKDRPIFANSKIDILGTRLSGQLTKLRIGTAEVEPKGVSDRKISIDLSSISAKKLRAGLQGIQVIHYDIAQKNRETEQSNIKIIPRRVRQSNTSPFMLLPIIESVQVTTVQNTSDELRSAVITIAVNPNIGKTQRVVVLLNEISDRDPAEYLFDIPIRDEDTNQITTTISQVKPGNYLVRVSIDGAESLLGVERDSQSPDFEKYIKPKLTIS